jgi:16S rRNA processing protein RimM
MAYNDNILLGRITKVSGYEGAVTVKLEKIFSENIPEMESVFLEIEGRPVPFFISDIDYSGADIVKLTFDGYNSIEKVSEFSGCRVFLTSSDVAEKKKDDLQTFIGYTVFDQNNILLGLVSEVTANPGQWLMHIITPLNKEILVPLHEHFIVRIDKKKKVLEMDIPDGLTEIN